MSLKAKDISLITIMVASVLSALYIQYFAGLLYRVYSPYFWAATVALLLVFLKMTVPGQDLMAYFKAAKAELRKVVWPSKSEVMPAFIAVGVAVTVFSFIISFMDSVIVRLLSAIIG